MNEVLFVFWHGPAVGSAILASVGFIAIIASWLTSQPLVRFGLRRIGIWLMVFGLVFLAVVYLLIVLPGQPDDPSQGISLDICIIGAIFLTSLCLEKLLPGFHPSFEDKDDSEEDFVL